MSIRSRLVYVTCASLAVMVAAGFFSTARPLSAEDEGGSTAGKESGGDQAKPDDAPTAEAMSAMVFDAMLGRFDAEFESVAPDGNTVASFIGKVRRESMRPGVISETVTFLDGEGKRQTIDTTWSIMPGGVSFATLSSMGPDMMHGYGSISAGGKRMELECRMNGTVQVLVSEFLVGEEVDEKGETVTWPYERHSMYDLVPAGEGKPAERVLSSRVVFTPADLTAPEAAAAFGYMLPSQAHKRLADMEGEWTTKVSVNLAGLLVFEGTGTASAKLVMGKRFVEERHTFTLPMGPVELTMTIGHNNGTGMFEVARAMSLATGIDTMSGRHNASTGAIECEGRAWEPRIGDFVRQRASIGKSADGKRKLTLELNYGKEWVPAVTVEYQKQEAVMEEPAKAEGPAEPAKPGEPEAPKEESGGGKAE